MQEFFLLVSGILEAYIFWDIFSCEFEKRFEKKWYVFLYWGIAIILNMVISLIAPRGWNTISFIVVYGTAAFLFFQGDKKIKLVFFVMYLFIMMFTELLGSVVYAAFTGDYLNSGGEGSRFVWMVVSTLTILYKFIAAKIWVYICGKRRHRVEGKTFMMVMIFPLVSCAIGIILLEVFYFTEEKVQIYIVIAMLLLILMNMVVYYPFEKMTELLNEQREFELFRLKNDLEQNHYNRIEELASKQRIYQHDVRQYMSAIASLIAKEENEEAKKIFEQMQIQVNELEQVTYSRSGILNALLNEKVNQAKGQGVLLQLEIEPTVPLSFLKETDMIAMFGNLIDNAIRAAAQCKGEKEVTIRLFEPEGNFILFIVENPYMGTLKKVGTRFISTKEDKEEHGIGLLSVQGLAEKYGGILDLREENGFFIATLSLAKDFYFEN
ncbi:MAG: sensor histidine kinase [Roseburia sp.]